LQRRRVEISVGGLGRADDERKGDKKTTEETDHRRLLNKREPQDTQSKLPCNPDFLSLGLLILASDYLLARPPHPCRVSAI
jgi:hypothetical protein